ncbi:MAG: hypothetical protein CVU08_04250 [Bacteroidetes bacterium HGW-Bacteroidetes-3]|nr:MAG: hypothetical protein CVU08_04250 [Bacteroidetes bacterium HGW-Bacteroidetes-3]
MQKSHKYSDLKLIILNLRFQSNEPIMKKVISILTIVFFLFSCNNGKKEVSDKKSGLEKQEVAANYKTIEVEIEGMTCEIGCAKTIESKLSKTQGVTYSKVNFEGKVGYFTFDENKINQEDIAKKIAGIGGGALYKATKITEIEEIK